MKLIEVKDPVTLKKFYDFPRKLYKKDPWWVCPLDAESEAKFLPRSNPFLREGKAIRWILLDENNNTIGRIAAFFNQKKAFKNEQPTGGIGWFECINNQKAAQLLFETAKNWLTTHGMQAMEGPVNFGENDNNWGLLVEGFTHPGYGMPYHPPYYKELFERYGFKEYYRQYSYHLQIRKPFPERFWKIADWVSKKPGFSFRHFRFRESEQFIADMVKIYNEAWKEFKEDFSPLDPATVQTTFQKAKAILDEKLIWFAYHEGEPIAFFIMLPDVNQILKYMYGKLHFWNILRFLVLIKMKRITRVRAIVAGVVPRFQNSGIESAIFKKLEGVFFSKDYRHYKEIELSWVGDFNPKMRSLYEACGAELSKVHITYRYLFIPDQSFRRYMPEALETAGKFHIKQHHVCNSQNFV